MKTWKIDLKVDPLLTLSSSKNKAILHFIKRDLLDEEVKSNKLLWKLPEVGKILKSKIPMDLGNIPVVRRISEHKKTIIS